MIRIFNGLTMRMVAFQENNSRRSSDPEAPNEALRIQRKSAINDNLPVSCIEGPAIVFYFLLPGY